MPTYHYACSTCKNEFDQYQTYAEESLTVCPTCEGAIRRVILPVGVVFKGSGWYLTDSRKAQGDDKPKDAAVAKASDGKPAGDKKPEVAAKTADGTTSKTDAPAPKPSAEKSVESKATSSASS